MVMKYINPGSTPETPDKKSQLKRSTQMDRFRLYSIFVLLIIVTMFLSSCGYVESSNAKNLTTGEGFIDPIGFYDSSPVFSWKLPVADGITSQSAYRIIAASKSELLPKSPDLWDTGKVISDQSIGIRYAGKPLTSRQEVYWAVMFWDQDGNPSPWSSTANFELGLLANTDWKGNWIRLTDDDQVPEEVNVEIVKAVYGILSDPEKQVDVTEVLRKRGNRSSSKKKYIVQADNALAGRDPAFGASKTLSIQYRLNGQLKSIEIKEGVSSDLISGKKTSYVPEYFRREFSVNSPVTKARLYITAKGVYEVSLDGTKVGQDFMAPGYTPYHSRIETLCYDVTKQIRKGSHCIGAILGEGWYAGHLMTKKDFYPKVKPYLLVQLELTYEDGRSEMILSDDSWKGTRNGPIRFSGIYDGEIYDARLEMKGWNRIGFDDTSWLPVKTAPVGTEVTLAPKRHNSVRKTEILNPVRVSEPAPGKFVFDLGQNIVGWPILQIPVLKDKTITVRFAEMCETDGTLYTANYRSAKSTDTYTAKADGIVTWHPSFTFHGFRYVELSGFPEGNQPSKDWVKGAVLHSAFKQTGLFESSHAKLNKLQQNITWGQRGNFLDIPTDCPQRDERLGWTGDAQVFCPTSIFNYDVHSFWASWLESIRLDQTEDGLIPHFVPTTGAGAGSPGWGDVAVTAPWDIYVRTGDVTILEDNYEMMKKWTAAYQRQAKGFIVNRGGFGDWLQPHAKNTWGGDTPKDLVATAYFGRCARILASVADVLGYKDQSADYRRLHANIKKAFSKKYFDDNGKLTVTDTQTAYLMALGYDLVQPQLIEKVTRNLHKSFIDADRHLRTGFLGTPLIAPVFDRLGYNDVSCELLFKESYPSWFYSINQGATTMWERWNSYSHSDGFGDAGMNSFNHYAYGAIGQWMYERIAGLAPNPKYPGYKHFFIQPIPSGPLTYAKAELDTPYGIARSGWEKKNDGLLVKATVPPNSTATVIVPQMTKTKPLVTTDGKNVPLTQADGHYQFNVSPGSYIFKIQ